MKKFTVGLIFLPAENSPFFGYMPAYACPAGFRLENGKVVEVDYTGEWKGV